MLKGAGIGSKAFWVHRRTLLKQKFYQRQQEQSPISNEVKAPREKPILAVDETLVSVKLSLRSQNPLPVLLRTA